MATAIADYSAILKTEPSAELVRRIRKKADGLSMLPTVAVEALDIAENPNCAIREFSAVVERDLKLASDILGMANSALYSRGNEIVSLHQAVVRLGFVECKNLILTASVAGLMKKLSDSQTHIRELLWQHSFTTALACMQLNCRFHLGFQGEEFTAGLIHDMGRTLLAVACPDNFLDADPLDFLEGPEILLREQEIVGTNHASFGAWFVAESKLPSSLVDVIRYHHTPELATGHRGLTSLVMAADHMANYLQRSNDYAAYVPEENAGIQLLIENGHPRLAEQFPPVAAQILDEIARNFKELSQPRSS